MVSGQNIKIRSRKRQLMLEMMMKKKRRRTLMISRKNAKTKRNWKKNWLTWTCVKRMTEKPRPRLNPLLKFKNQLSLPSVEI